MRNETTNTAVPKLRFPEFREAEEWEEKALGSIMPVTSCRRVHESDWTKEGVPFFRAREIVALSKRELITPLFISEALYQKNIKLSGEVKSGDLMVTGVGTIGIAYLVKQDDRFYFKDGNIIWFQNSGEELLGDFLYWLYESNYIKKQISRMAGIGTVGTYTIDSARRTLIPLPSKSEQQKIAATFSSLENLLTAHSAKLAALQAHKRGLMQGLFPAEGETVPKLRFPEFRDEWQKNSLANLTDLLSGYAFQSAFFSASGKKLLTPKNFTRTGYASFNNGNTKYTTEPFDSKYICKEGDLLLLLTDLTPSCELLGKPVLLTKNDGEVLLNQRIVKIIPKSDAEIDFLFHFFSTDAYHKRIRETASGSTVRHSSNKIIASTELYLPSKEEQQKIADCLTSLDNRITAQTQKIEALKLHKKGLMQGLFPAAAEPTA